MLMKLNQMSHGVKLRSSLSYESKTYYYPYDFEQVLQTVFVIFHTDLILSKHHLGQKGECSVRNNLKCDVYQEAEVSLMS